MTGAGLVRLPRELRSWVLPLAAVALAVPVVVSATIALSGGWIPTADVAVMSLRVGDVFSADPPLVGMHTTASEYGSPEPVFHPGPMTLWLLAPFVLLFGEVVGMVVGAAALNLAVLGGCLWVARRLAGAPLVGLTAVALGLLLWALRGDILRDPWNPHLAILGFVLFLLLSWSVSNGDGVVVPLLLAVGTYLVQNHVTYALLVVVLTVWACAGLWFGLRGSRAAKLSAVARPAAIGGGVLVLLWLPPLIDLVAGRGNLVNIVRTALEAEGGRLGLVAGAERLTASLGAAPLWLSHTSDIFRVAQSPSVTDLIVAAAVLAALAYVAVLAWRRRDRRTFTGVGTALVALVAAVAVLASAPTEDALRLYWYRWLWPLGMFSFLLLAWGAFRTLPVPSRASLAPAMAPAALAALGVLLVLGFAQPPISEDVDGTRYELLGALAEQTGEELGGSGPYVLSTDGTMFWHTSTLAAALERAGVRVLVQEDNLPWGDKRLYREGRPIAGRLHVIGGPDAGDQDVQSGRLVTFIAVRAESRGAVAARIREQVSGRAVPIGEPGILGALIDGTPPDALAAQLRVAEWPAGLQAWFGLLVETYERDGPTDPAAPLALDLASLSDEELLEVFGFGSGIAAVDLGVLSPDVRAVLRDPLFQDGYADTPGSGMASYLLDVRAP